MTTTRSKRKAPSDGTLTTGSLCFVPSAFAGFHTRLPPRCARRSLRALRAHRASRAPRVQMGVEGEVDWVVVDVTLRGLDAENRIHASALEVDGRALVREIRHNEPAELSVVLCSDAEMTKLNANWRGKDRPTDVLSFPQNDEVVLGDIVISVETARRQAEERHKNLRDELRVLLVHGVLHLVGYDHERSPAELERMANEEQRLLEKLAWEGEGLVSYTRDKQQL